MGAFEQERKRLFIGRKTTAKERLETVNWAVDNKYDTLVFSLNDRFFKRRVNAEYAKLAKKHGFFIEAGGSDMSLLLHRRFFLFHRDLFRMELGKRSSNHHFCPTNPETTSRITARARFLFSRAMVFMTEPRIFHLLPDEGNEQTWCACPACRAFTPAEQNLIAVSSAADALLGLDPDARLSFLDLYMEPETNDPQVDEPEDFEPQVFEPQVRGIAPRKNMFRLSSSPLGHQNEPQE